MMLYSASSMVLFVSLVILCSCLVKQSKSTFNSNINSKAWELVRLPGKGTGVIACRDVEIGECLMNEKPILVLPTASWYTPTESQINQKVNVELEKLSDDERITFFNMFSLDHDEDEQSKDTYPDESSYLVSKALGIFRSNGYPLPGSEGRKFGVFPLISRLNSACNPNAHFTYNINTNKGYIHAISNIKKGSEIMNNYYPLLRPRSDRRAYLQEHFRFQCQCDVCLLPDDLSEISDIRRQRLFTLEVNTYALITSGRYDEAKLLISERLSLLREEKINTPATRLPCLVDAIIAELKYLSIYEVLAALIQPKIDNSDDRIKYEIDSAVLSALSSSSTPTSSTPTSSTPTSSTPTSSTPTSSTPTSSTPTSSTPTSSTPTSSTVNNTNTSDSIHTSSHSFLELVKEAALTARTCKGVESIEYEGLSQLEDRVLELSINITI